jgi:hypothetical protein
VDTRGKERKKWECKRHIHVSFVTLVFLEGSSDITANSFRECLEKMSYDSTDYS